MDLYNAEHFKLSSYNQLIINALVKTPKLPAIPPLHRQLSIKVTDSGATWLRNISLRSRCTGSRSHKVDMNGVLHKSEKDFKKFIQKEAEEKAEREGKKKVPGRNPGRTNILIINEPKDTEKLSTKEKKQREYSLDKKVIRARIATFIKSMPGEKILYFFTITFPKGTDDLITNQLLNTWLTVMRKRHGLKHYLYVAERQENGTVHYHLAIPQRLSVQAGNRVMRAALRTMAKRGAIPFNEWQCKRYNGVDIAKNRKTRRVTNFAVKKGRKSLLNYMTKYCTKNDGKFPFLAWHNSRSFSALFTSFSMTVEEFKVYGFDRLLVQKDGRAVCFAQNEFFAFYAWSSSPPWQVTKLLRDLNQWVLQNWN